MFREYTQKFEISVQFAPMRRQQVNRRRTRIVLPTVSGCVMIYGKMAVVL